MTGEQKPPPKSEENRDPCECRKRHTHCIHGLIFTEGLGEEILSPLVLDCAHRPLAAKLKPGDRPRPMIDRLNYYSDKEKILRLSRNKAELKERERGKDPHIPGYERRA